MDEARSYVAQHRQRLEPGDEARDPPRELAGVGVLQAVLEFRAADTIVDREVLHRLHEELHPLDPGKLRLQAPDDLGRADAPLVERLEVDLNASAVDRAVRAVDTNERR